MKNGKDGDTFPFGTIFGINISAYETEHISVINGVNKLI
jgi:hypothetical protein